MSMFYLEASGTISDIFCPNCNSGYNIEWQTEYGYPITGRHDIECPDCGHQYTMSVFEKVIYIAIDKEIK